MTDLQVQVQRLPGIGWRYTIPADRGRHVMVVTEDRGPRHLALVDPRLDRALTTVRLPDEHASVLAALLTGARFTMTASDDIAGVCAARPLGGRRRDTAGHSGSPAVGLTQDEVAPRLGTDAALLGVIDDRPLSSSTPRVAGPSVKGTHSSLQRDAGLWNRSAAPSEAASPAFSTAIRCRELPPQPLRAH
jgi:hypothetical protein